MILLKEDGRMPSEITVRDTPETHWLAMTFHLASIVFAARIIWPVAKAIILELWT